MPLRHSRVASKEDKNTDSLQLAAEAAGKKGMLTAASRSVSDVGTRAAVPFAATEADNASTPDIPEMLEMPDRSNAVQSRRHQPTQVGNHLALVRSAGSEHSKFNGITAAGGDDDDADPVHHLVAFVIPRKFFVDARAASQHVTEPMRVVDGHLINRVNRGAGAPAASTAQPVATAWRRLLVSPLVGFLTDVKNKHEWIQLSGHMGNFLPGSGGTICKKVGELERAAYERLMEEDEPMRDFVPLYFKEVEIVEGEWYLEIEDLLANFTDPCAMDIKMGTRTFMESEVTKKKVRMDLLQKMIALDPNEPSDEEKANGITKLRYMTYREVMSSSRTLGFRIEGIRLVGEKPQNNFRKIRTREEVDDVVRSFLPPHGHPLRDRIIAGFLERLEDLRDALERSMFFKYHSVIGSSLLFLYDQNGEVGIWIIDFGKTLRVDTPLTHRSEWQLGNQEDGYLFGLDHIVDLMNGALGS